MLFVRCDIDNPSFDSQTKDYMSTPISSFGSSCEVSEKFIEKLDVVMTEFLDELDEVHKKILQKAA